MPSRTRPPDSSSSAPISMAISVGCRPNGLNTPAPMLWVLVASAQAVAAVMMPRAKGFSANQTASMPAASAARACSTQACGVIPPCSRTLSLGSFATCLYTPPGRGPESAGEKCACTTRQVPASLRNTMVEREMNSWPL